MSDNQLHIKKQQALTLFRSNQLAEAKIILSELCEDDPEDTDTWYLLSCIYGMQGNMDEVDRCCRRVITLRPDHSDAHINLGNVLLYRGKLAEAASHYKTALHYNPDNAGAHCSLGNALSSQGNHAEAAASYQAALRLNPNFVAAYYNLGNSQMALNDFEAAINSFRQATLLNPNYAEAYNNLGNAYKENGDINAAIENYHTAVRLQPNYARAYNNLAIVLKIQGMLPEAYEAARQALHIDPDFADALLTIGNITLEQRNVEEAITWLKRAVDKYPRFAEAYNNLGIALMRNGELEDAKRTVETALTLDPKFAEALFTLGEIYYEQANLDGAIGQYKMAIAENPDYSEVYIRLGNALTDLRRLDDAVNAYRQAIKLNPNSATAYSNLARTLKSQLRLDEAEKTAKQALEIQPDHVVAHITLGNIYLIQGKPAAATEMCRKALQIEPDNVDAHTNYLLGIHYLGEYSPEALYSAARDLGSRYDSNLTSLPPPENNPDPKRLVRIGYVSADFMNHPIGYFIEQVLAHHNKNRFEIFCYSNKKKTDDLTKRLQQHTDHWRVIYNQTDDAVCEQIRHDGIDLLIDLSGYTAGNRLITFSYKPAPVQVTWLGYFDTTGLNAMDYIMADQIVIPADGERYFTEKVMRLPNAYLCFSPPDIDVTPSPLPALTSGKVTFGCFNHPAKITDDVIVCWSKVLRALPNSQLYLKYMPYGDAHVQRRYRDLFSAHGINSDRIIFSGYSLRHDLLAAYRDVDIGLDPYPYTGGTTTLEALWMGIPVVSLLGDHFVSRITATLLTNAGLKDCVTDNEEQYITKAVSLASDLPRLGRLRQGLRSQLSNSVLCDGPRFTANLEAAYLRMWEAWCQTQQQPS